MNTPNDGGPAITQEAFNKVIRERDEARAEAKTSLRDRFAGYALANQYCQHDKNPDDIALWAYQVADAMLAARDGKEGA